VMQLFLQIQWERNGTWQFSFLSRWFKACAGLRRLEVSNIVHEQSIEVVASLMSLWAVAWWTCMSIEDAWRVSNKMPSPNLVTFGMPSY
jgi:hypothetical protein